MTTKHARQRRAARRMKAMVSAGLIGAAVMGAASEPAHAIDINSADYVPLPDGTNLLLFYAQYATRSEYVNTSGVSLSHDTSLDSYVNILRYVRYFEVAGFNAAVQTLIPAGTLYNARVGGAGLDAAAGMADPIFSFVFWPISNKATNTYVAIAPYIFAPLGQYNRYDALNMGENRWKLDLQAAWYQGLPAGFSFQLAGDVIWYGNNSETASSLTLSQDNTYQFQGWLSWAFAETWSASVGYSKYWGGTEYLGGIATGNATQKDQLRLELSKFITPTFQVLGLVQRDFNTEGGFPEDFRGTVRLTQVF